MMGKKKMKKRIKELEAENIMLRTMAMQPVYIYLYDLLPYRHYWQPYRCPQPIGPITCEPNWEVTPDSHTWVINNGEFVGGVDWSNTSDMTVTSIINGYSAVDGN